VHISAELAGAQLQGEVVETHFFGGSSTTSVRVAEMETLIVASHPGAPKFAVGERVGISWNADDAILLEDQP
jgi:ABC-type Fe3+/spermidine/putrescine transport system ATPase subunit